MPTSPTYPKPLEALRALDMHADRQSYRVIAATLLPRMTWDGAGFDVAWEGTCIAVLTSPTHSQSGTLAQWEWTLRHGGVGEHRARLQVCRFHGSYGRKPAQLGEMLKAKAGNEALGCVRNQWYAPTSAARVEWLPHYPFEVVQTWQRNVPWSK